MLLVNFPFIGFLYENFLEPKITNILQGVISVAVNINLEYTILIHTFIKISIG